MKWLLFLLLLVTIPASAQTQCPLRYMFQYYPALQVNATQSIENDSTTSYLLEKDFGDGVTGSPSVGWTVTDADSFGVYLRTDSSVFISIQHDGPSGTFVIDTFLTGPFAWHEVAIAVTPRQHNYSVMLYPINPTGPLRSTVFGVPVYFGAAYQWNRVPASVTYEQVPNRARSVRWYNLLGMPVDSSSALPRGAYFSDDGRRMIR